MIQAPSYSLSQDSLFTRLDSRALVVALLTLWHKLRCFKCYQPYTPYCCQTWILTRYHSLALFLWYLISAVIYERHCEFSIFWVIRACKLACLLGVTLKKNRETWFLACGFAWFWSICYLARLSHLMHSFGAWFPYCRLTFEVPRHDEDFIDKPSSVFGARKMVFLWFSTLSVDWDFFHRKRKDDICNWIQKACD